MRQQRLTEHMLRASMLLFALFLLTADPASAQAPPGDTTVYLPIASTFRVTQPIAAGGAHSCAVLPTGVVRCWGDNSQGQLGDGTTISSTLPVTVQGLAGAHAVAAGNASTCAAAGEGVYCWGAEYGPLPTRVEDAPRVTHLAFFGKSTCGLGTGATVTCWTVDKVPMRIEGITGATAFASGFFPCVLASGGMLQCWEMGQFFNLMPDNGELEGVFTWPGVSNATAAASYHWNNHYKSAALIACVTDAAGDVACWTGGCDFGLGCFVPPMAPNQPEPWAAGARTFAAANRTLCALRHDGRVVCGGDPEYGEGGLGTSDGRGVAIPGIEGATAVSMGANHVCAMHGGRQVTCWGDNWSGQLGSAAVGGSVVPLAIPVGDVKAVSAGGESTCSVGDDGKVACWGAAAAHPLSGPQPGRYVPQPFALPQAATQVSADYQTACALMPGTGIACSPLNWQSAPSLIAGTQGATALGNGGSFDCYLESGGGVYCWWGDPLVTKRVQGLPKARNIAVGTGHGCAVTEERRVACWEWTGDGIESAEVIPNLARVDQMAMTEGGACALRSDGNVSCWDFPSEYTDPPNQSPAPIAVAGLDHIIAIATAGLPWNYYDRRCALRNDGAVLCWSGSVDRPVDLFRLPGATTLTIGNGHICVTTAGQLYCQGDNSRGQLAHNPGWTPVRVVGLEP